MNYEKVKYIMLLWHTIAVDTLYQLLYLLFSLNKMLLLCYWINAYFIKDQAIHSEPELHVLIHNHTQIHMCIRVE